MLVFDREGYSYELFAFLLAQRIAFCTYNKYVKEEWPEDEFTDCEMITPDGETETIQLAERQTVLCAKKEKGEPQQQITVREIRKRTVSGHQTSIITTNYILSVVKIALLMFSRWCQKNFFKYMVESFGIDSIVSYLKNPLPDMSQVTNPQYKELERQYKSITTRINNRKLKYAAISLQNKELSMRKIERYIKKKSELQFEIENFEKQRMAIAEQKNGVEKKILFKDLDENQKFQTSVNERKFFLDTIKIIAYRAKTALCNIIKKKMTAQEQARMLIRKIYASNADIQTDETNALLIVKIHRTNHWVDDNILEYLCEHLNDTHTTFPATNLTCLFKLVPS